MSFCDDGITVGVIDYGAGNLGNVRRALVSLGFAHVPLKSAEEIDGAVSFLILPGVGAFRPAMEKLVSSGWSGALSSWVQAGRPLLGICLGMQLLCEVSAEGGAETRGLGFADGEVRELSGIKKIPHMGWNTAAPRGGAENFPACCMDGDQFFYFVHGFAVSSSRHCAASTAVDGVEFCSILRNGHVAGFQFHPERSGPGGVKFLGRAIKYFAGKGNEL
ncbi:imidazole glycerol phosphate synthase, glutamine amidotransferase subunit [Synergistales bacterium]|nr:imidazole glycerol phosphate synthase, glutamine amidotransferase subunit [Synergistales bacterium]GHV50564.1 imidazole glycerol phosphate synthase, glutamine amidotransferase subunit [Synergistales bacterium]